MAKGLLTLLGAIALIAICIWLFFAIGAILLRWLWLIFVIFAVILVFDWLIGPRYIWVSPPTVIVTKKVESCDVGFHIENDICIENEK